VIDFPPGADPSFAVAPAAVFAGPSFNLRRFGYRPFLVTNVSADDGLDTDVDLAESLHRVLATLTMVRHDRVPLTADRLRERLELIGWLRRELAAAEELLLTEYRNAEGGSSER
jgi:hypothetical protein